MDKVQKTFRNFQTANQAFRNASARYKVASNLYGWWSSDATNLRKARNLHENMLKAYGERTNAYNAFRASLTTNAGRRALAAYEIHNYGTMTMNQIMNSMKRFERKWAPGGIEYEKAKVRAANRWTRKPSRRLSTSPKRRKSSLKRRHSV